MKVSKLLFFISLLMISGPFLGFVFFESYLPHILPHKDNEFLVHLAVNFFAIGVLIASYFPEKFQIRRILENGSLILATVFYRMLIGSDFIEKIPVWIQLPFLLAFGFFLYFKLMRYFNRDKEKLV